MLNLSGLTRILLPPLICVVAVSGCAYTKYMAEARESQQHLKEQLVIEQDKSIIIKDESTQHEIERDQLLKEKKQLEQDLVQRQKRLAKLSSVPPPRRTVSQQAEIEKLQSQIKRTQASIAEKKGQLNREFDY